MKLAPRDAAGFLSRPDPRVPALLIFGTDAMRVAERRQRVVAAQIGPQGEGEMRLTRFAAADLRRDPAAAMDAMRAQGFFPGPRAVLIEDATDAATDALKSALAAWAEGDALMVVTSGALNAGSKLRKLFEGDKRALCLAVYDDPPGRAEIEAQLRAEGLTDLPPEALRDLVALGQGMEPGDFRQMLTRIALYKLGDSTPLSAQEIALLAPPAGEAAVDSVLDAVADGRLSDIAPLMTRLAGQGVAPVTLCIGALRHFRQLHRVTGDPRGPDQAVAGLRPPVFGPRRDRLLRQARRWPNEKVEIALGELITADLSLRSSSPPPAHALIERVLMRLAALAARSR
ncbi:MAG: DNA polymerase III subunit delta [Pararhodobacter sp.]|nr:DNA polymerase III subunit delta [Pararhodobacter sp.]